MERKRYTTAEFPVSDTTKKKRKGEQWCPYCGEWTKFKYGVDGILVKDSWWKRCPVCLIGVEDFWFKKVNNDWH